VKAILFAILVAGCGAGGGNQVGPDGGDDLDGGAGGDGGTTSDGGDGGSSSDAGTDGGSTSDGGTDAGTDGGTIMPVPLEACANAPAKWGPLPTGVTWPQLYDPGPLMTRDARAFVFLEGSSLWTVAQAGAASTATKPAALTGSTFLGGFSSLAGPHVLTFLVQNAPHARTFDGTTFGPDLAIPCNYLGADCVVRAAPDGHVWVRNNGVFHEQTGTTFANRGGGPAGPMVWDIDASGAIVMLAYGDSLLAEKLAVWKLAAGAGGWTKVGALLASDVAAASSAIEGGFQLGASTIARDGSFHVFSDARCIGTGQRNKTQVYIRSRDGVAWTVETLPAADTLHTTNVTWSHNAIWASDHDNVRVVITSSPKPTFDGWEYHYPDRRYDLVGRCLDQQGNPTFGVLASTRNPGWTTRGYASFSSTGAAAFLTSEGLVQVAD
jgi:hypothetical protein